MNQRQVLFLMLAIVTAVTLMITWRSRPIDSARPGHAEPATAHATPSAGEPAPAVARIEVSPAPRRTRGVPTPTAADAVDPVIALRGRVVDASQEPIAGARVWVRVRFGTIEVIDRETTTASDGTFSLRCASEGSASVAAWHVGFAPTEARATTRGQPTVMVLSKGVTVRGRVRCNRGHPVSGALVALALRMPTHSENAFPTGTPETITAVDGTFELHDVPAGHFELRARDDDHAVGSVTATGDGPIEITVQHLGTISGIAVDAATGAPVAGARVNADHITDASGRFTVKRSLPPRHRPGHSGTEIDARCDGYAPKIVRVNDSTDQVRLELVALAVFRGQVLDAARQPVAHATVRLWPRVEALPSDERAHATSRDLATDADGRFAAQVLAIPHRAVEVTRSGQGVWAFAGVDFEAGGTVEREYVLAAGGAIRGCVRDDGGVPMPSVEVRLWCRGIDAPPGAPLVQLWRTHSDALGEFTFEQVTASEAWVVASASGHPAAAHHVMLEGGRTRVSLDLVKGESLEGEVYDWRGSPLTMFQVLAKPELPPPLDQIAASFQIQSVGVGRFRIDGLPRAAVRVTVRPPSSRRWDLGAVEDQRIEPPFARQTFVLPERR